MKALQLARRATVALAILFAAGLARGQVLTTFTSYAWQGSGNSNVVLLSPDETLLFVSNQYSASVSVLALAPDGVPSLAGIHPTGSAPCGMALNPAGDRLYVATEEGIYAHAVAAGGALTFLQAVSVPGLTRPLFTGIQYASLPAGGFVYLNENVLFAENRVSAYRVEPDGTLAPVASYPTGDVGSVSGLYAPPRLLETAGERLFVANGASVSVFDILPDGLLAIVPGSPFFSPVPPAPLPFPGPPAVAVAADPSGAWLYATLDGVSVVRFAVAPDGALAFDALFTSDATYPMTGIAVHPSGAWVVASYGPSGARVWDATQPPAFVQRTAPTGAGIAWNGAGTLLFGGGATGDGSRVRVSRFGPAEAFPAATCVGSPMSPAVVPTAPDLCGVAVDAANGLAGTCRDAASCTFDGLPSLVLPLGPGTVAVVATSASGATATCTSFVEVVDGTPPAASCPPPATLECTGPTTPFAMVAGCTDACGCAVTCFEGPLPLGTWDLSCEARDSAKVSACSVPVSVVDTAGPHLALSTTPAVLWPPDHRLVPIDLHPSAWDACDPSPAISCIASSSEPDDGVADGDTTGDVQWDAEGRLWLRAERAGTGPGRSYTVTCTATDGSGNSGAASAQVVVPHDEP